MRPIETINYANGVYAEIFHDEDCERPYQDDDGLKIVILHRHYTNPSKDVGSTGDAVMQWAKDNAREWFVANLFMYEHGNVALRAGERNPFGDPWDSGQVGIVALKKSEWGKGKGEKNAKRMEYAKNVAEEYGRWMNGECYGYQLKNADDDDLDSCWGFIGMEYAMEEAKDAAEYYVKEEGARIVKEAEEEAARIAAELEAERPDLYEPA